MLVLLIKVQKNIYTIISNLNFLKYNKFLWNIYSCMNCVHVLHISTSKSTQEYFLNKYKHNMLSQYSSLYIQRWPATCGFRVLLNILKKGCGIILKHLRV